MLINEPFRGSPQTAGDQKRREWGDQAGFADSCESVAKS
jgi:hypothetical protein